MKWWALLLMVSSLAYGEGLTRVANTSLNLPEVEPGEDGFMLENAFGSLRFSEPVAVRSAPGEPNSVYIVEKRGRIQRVNLLNNTRTQFFDVASFAQSRGWVLQRAGEQGLLSMAFHPNFQQNGWFYVFYSVSISNVRYQRVARFTVVNGRVNAASHTSLISQRDEAGNHNGGDMHFGPDGHLYVSVGDEGGAADVFANGNRIDRDFFSAILRLDVDSSPGSLAPNAHANGGGPLPSAVGSGYRIPADNPFIGETSHLNQAVIASNVRTEIWVTGLRNPWRFSFDDETGRCFVADVGQNRREEVNLVTGGEDCGWSRREGRLTHPGGQQTADPFHSPIHEYGRGDGVSITGGVVYRGESLPELVGRYVFSDFMTGTMWALRETDNGWTREALLTSSGVAAFGHDPRNGELLVCSLSGGFVGRLVRSIPTNAAPQTLSATGAFSSLQSLAPRPGIYPYSVNQPFWSDYAVKRRWFSIPDTGDVMNFSADGDWDFPEGQVWIKHFDLERERGNPATSEPLETRFLIKTENSLYGLSYRWRADGSEADLVASDGFEEDLAITVNGAETTQRWSYPSRNDCRSCHRPQNNYALSFNSRQLNGAGDLGNDQIDALSCAGFLDAVPPPSTSIAALPALDDETVSVEARVRAYLDVNCAMCHRQDTSLVPGTFDARLQIQTDDAGLVRGELADGGSDAANRVIVPGDLTHSMLLQRLTGAEARMPPLASSETDPVAIALFQEWITGDLTTRESYDEWSVRTLGEIASGSDDDDSDGSSNRLEYLAGTNPADGASSFSLEVDSDGLTFPETANRRTFIEQSEDMQTWVPLEVTGNTQAVSAQSGEKTLTLPQLERLFLRARLSAP